MSVERTEINYLHRKVRIEKFELETFCIGRIVNMACPNLNIRVTQKCTQSNTQCPSFQDLFTLISGGYKKYGPVGHLELEPASPSNYNTLFKIINWVGAEKYSSPPQKKNC